VTPIIVLLILVWALGTRIFGRRYFGLKHGVPYSSGELGTIEAALMGAAWPATLWSSSFRDPPSCSHRNHLLASERARNEVQEAERIRREREADRG
jgi:hypothetical protein